MEKIWEAIKYSLLMIWDNLYYLFVKNKEVSSTPNDFKFMSFNIRRDIFEDRVNAWRYRREACVKMIELEKPSILCMQEIMPGSSKYLISKLNQKYEFYGRDSRLGLRLDLSLLTPLEGLAIMFDRDRYVCFDKGCFWLSNNSHRPSMTWSNNKLSARICIYLGLMDKITGEEFYVFNTHFYANGKESLKLSADFVAAKIKQIAGNLNSYFCGDLNDNWNSDNLKAFDEIYTNKTGNCGPTYNGFNDRKKVIDAIYYNEDGRKVEVYSEKGKYDVEYISDHWPLAIY